jgi:hypothetical protein
MGLACRSRLRRREHLRQLVLEMERLSLGEHL